MNESLDGARGAAGSEYGQLVVGGPAGVGADRSGDLDPRFAKVVALVGAVICALLALAVAVVEL